MGALEELRAACRAVSVPPEPPEAYRPLPGPPRGQSASPRLCPFTFGPWIPAEGPEGAYEAAERAVMASGTLVAWWRRSRAPWLPLPGEPVGPPVPIHTLATPDGRPRLCSSDPQALLEELADRLNL
jgi:hypothetical protein